MSPETGFARASPLTRWGEALRLGARSSLEIDADRTVVFDHLVEPRTFPEWLVGAQHIRAIDAAWPAVGSSFHHRVGAGPLVVNDSTEIISIRRPDELTLEARIGSIGSAIVRFRLEESDPTIVHFEEVPHRGPLRLAASTVGYLVVRASIWGRNRTSLQHLKALIERGRT